MLEGYIVYVAWGIQPIRRDPTSTCPLRAYRTENIMLTRLECKVQTGEEDI